MNPPGTRHAGGCVAHGESIVNKTVFSALLAAAAFAGAARADLIAGWSFNDTANLLGASHGAGTMTTSFTGANLTSFTGTVTNAVSGDAAGQALALVNQVNNGGTLTIQVSLTGFENPVLTFAGQRTGTGFNSDQIAYSTDGVSFTNFGSPMVLPSSFGTTVQTVDFSAIDTLDNAAAVYIRITFTGASSASGNNRLDNVQVNAAAVTPAPSAAALMGLGGLVLGRRRRA